MLEEYALDKQQTRLYHMSTIDLLLLREETAAKGKPLGNDGCCERLAADYILLLDIRDELIFRLAELLPSGD